MSNIHILLLAAGASSRMQTAKQLLPWDDVTLIEHQIKTLLSTDYPVTVVLGAFTDRIKLKINHLPVSIAVNEHWKEGMGKSIAFGVQKVIEASPSAQGILVALVDQPLLKRAHFENIISHFKEGYKQILVSKSSKGYSGPPVLFDAFYFDELMRQSGDDGAKRITKNHKDAITFIKMGAEMEDVDTPEAFAKAKEN